MKRTIVSVGLLAGLLVGEGAGAALIDSGDGLVHDTVLGVTWLKEPGLVPGLLTWKDTVAAVASFEFAGFHDWRLPSMDVNGDGVVVDCSTATELDCRDNELGYMYYHNLTPIGDPPPTDPGTLLTGDHSPFLDIEEFYWSSTETESATKAWLFFFLDGRQVNFLKENFYYTWPVRGGSVVAPPVATPGTPPGGMLALAAVGWLLGRCWRRTRRARVRPRLS